MRVHIILLLLAVFIISGPGAQWLRSAPRLAGSLLHHFFHANFFHLAANCLAVWTMFGFRWRRGWKELLAGYIIGSAAFFASPMLAIGMSDILFAVLGIRSVRNGWWKSSYFIVLWATLILTALIPSVSGLTHCLSCAGGMAVGWLSVKYEKLSVDYGKARGRS